MSLKHVHVAFVAMAMLLTLFCGFRAWSEMRSGGSMAYALVAIAALAVAGLLVRYQQRFLRSCREAGIQ